MYLNKKILGLLMVGVAILLLPAASAKAATTVGTNVAVAGTLTVAGATTLTGAATLSSTLTVTGLSTFTGGFISASSTVTQINVSGNLNASSTIFLGGNLLPSANNSKNIGAYGTAVASVYASTSLILGNGSNVIPITGHLSLLVDAVNLPDAATNTFKCTSSTLSVPGAALGDTVTVQPQTYDPAFAFGSLTPYIVTASNVDLVYCSGGGAITSNPGSLTYRVDVWKH